MGRVTQFVKLPAKAPPSADEFNRLQDRLVEALRVLRQSPQALLDARGSIVAATAAGAPAEHLVGSDTQVLTADSSAATGLSWTSGSPFANIADYGAAPGIDAVPAFQAAWAVSPVAIFKGNYTISDLTVPIGKSIMGLGPLVSRLTYAGTGGAITLDGCQWSVVDGFELVTTNAAATVRGIWLKNTTVASFRNMISRILFFQNSATPRAAGQFAVLLEDNSASTLAQFWHRVIDLEFIGWETCVGCLQTGAGADGVNASVFSNLVCASFISGVSFGPRCGDHTVLGLHGTHSSASVFSDTLLVIGDGVGASTGNICLGVNADLGANGRAFIINTASANNVVIAVNESSQADVDNGTNSIAISSKNLSGLNARISAPNITIRSSGSSFSGTLLLGKVQEADSRSVANTDVTLSTSDLVVVYTSIAADRTATLPAPFLGGRLIFYDASGSCTGAIRILVSGTINGTPASTGVAVASAFGSSTWLSTASTWFQQSSP